MDNQFTIITYENTNFTIGKEGDRLLNYIIKNSNDDLIIISTYFKSNLKYCTTLSGIPHNKIDFLINLLKQYTWTIEASKGIKTYNKEHKPMSLREYLQTEVHNLFSKVSIKVYETPPNIKSYINSYIKSKHNKSL